MAVLTWPQTFVPPESLNQREEGSTPASRNVLSITHQLSCPRTEEEYSWSYADPLQWVLLVLAAEGEGAVGFLIVFCCIMISLVFFFVSAHGFGDAHQPEILTSWHSCRSTKSGLFTFSKN